MIKRYTKEEIEMCLWDKFLELYNKAYNTNFQSIRNGIQGSEADIVCSNNLQLEIVSNHYSEKLKEKEAYQISHAWIFRSWPIFNSNEQALLFLLEHLDEKNQKLLNWSYWTEKDTFLIIDLRGNCLTTMLDFSNSIEKVDISSIKIEFDQVWLFHHRFIVNWIDVPESALYDNEYCIWQLPLDLS